MNIVSIDNYRSFPQLHPLRLLAQAHNRQVTGCLRIKNASESWYVYLRKGKLIYASNSINPFERLEYYLDQMSYRVPNLRNDVRTQIRQLFNRETGLNWMNPSDYQAIRWLADQKYLSTAQATSLIESLAREVLQPFLQVREGAHELVNCSLITEADPICLLELRPIVEFCQRKNRQRVDESRGHSESYATTPQSQTSTATPPTQTAPAVPPPPSLQKQPNVVVNRRVDTTSTSNQKPQPRSPQIANATPRERARTASKQMYKVACIDDSPTILHLIEAFLTDQGFTVILISDPLKALMELLQTKPDLILLDITMPNLDGYELCGLLRKRPAFKKTPIIMLTGNTGLIDRAKAKLVRASGYITKPFTPAELVKVIFKHLD